MKSRIFYEVEVFFLKDIKFAFGVKVEFQHQDKSLIKTLFRIFKSVRFSSNDEFEGFINKRFLWEDSIFDRFFQCKSRTNSRGEIGFE